MSSTQQENTVYEEKLDEAFWTNLFKQEAAQAPPADEQQMWPSGAEIPVFTDPGAANSTSWKLAEEVFRSDRVLELRVTGFNKGGLLVYWQDLQGFVPASQLVNFPLLHIAQERMHALAGLQGRTLRLKIIELNPAKNRLVLSERVAQVDIEQRVDLLFRLRPGDIVAGMVTNLSDFGAFVDLGGIEGLIHISELSWSRVVHPSRIVQPGQHIRVKVLRVDRERERIALSYKQMRPDPWLSAESRYRTGALVKGIVSNVTSFGAFVLLEQELEGLIHVSEMPEIVLLNLRDVIKEGQRITARVLHVNSADKRLALTLRPAAPAAE
ncbi:MAG: 30S ribosomal protein S1 [Candidatus Promineifilaceae bacterium]